MVTDSSDSSSSSSSDSDSDSDSSSSSSSSSSSDSAAPPRSRGKRAAGRAALPPPRRPAAPAAAAAAEEDDSEPEVGPARPAPPPKETAASRKRRRENEVFETHLAQLPSSQMYEQSLMHRDVVTHVAVTPRTDFAITASVDGHVKFWKKLSVGIEFVKHFVAHSAPINALAVSLDGLRAATTSEDGSVKVFSVATFDMVNIIELPFTPTCAAWIFRPGALECVLAVAEKDAGTIHCYNTGVSGGHAEAELSRCALHRHPVAAMAYSASADLVVSADVKGMLEYWCAEAELTPAAGAAAAADGDADDDGFKRVVRAHAAPRAPKRVSFRFKMDTGLYALVKAKTRPTSIAFDPAGERFVVSATDAHVRVFSLRSGALSHEYDESLAASAAAQARASGGAGDVGAGAMEEMDWSKRSAVERELLALQEKHTFPPRAQCSNALFDCSGAFVLFSTLTGVKVCFFIYRYILNEFCSRF